MKTGPPPLTPYCHDHDHPIVEPSSLTFPVPICWVRWLGQFSILSTAAMWSGLQGRGNQEGDGRQLVGVIKKQDVIPHVDPYMTPALHFQRGNLYVSVNAVSPL